LWGRNNHRARSHLSNGKHYNLGDSPWKPPGPINSLVCILFQPCFSSTIYCCINLEHLCLVFTLHLLFWINGPPPVGILWVYERDTSEKIKV
jgi:hypothetical protein